MTRPGIEARAVSKRPGATVTVDRREARKRLTDSLAEARMAAMELGEVGAAGVITGLMAAVRERDGVR
jgi:hypothetical protein